jgi:hypothetical protein
MSNDEYKATQDLLLQAGRMVDILDLNGFRDRIRHADSIGSVLDPTLYRDAHRNLQAIDELAAAAIRLKGAFQTLKSQVSVELEAVRDDA